MDFGRNDFNPPGVAGFSSTDGLGTALIIRSAANNEDGRFNLLKQQQQLAYTDSYPLVSNNNQQLLRSHLVSDRCFYDSSPNPYNEPSETLLMSCCNINSNNNNNNSESILYLSDPPAMQISSNRNERSQFPSQLYSLSYAGASVSSLSVNREAAIWQLGLPEAESNLYRGITTAQRAELFHHTLIYRYIKSGRPIPSELLMPIRNSVALLNTAYASRSHCLLPAMGWGVCHLGFASTDPEPGRCRRTDGKKWRCAKDVVPDQKYCERHMHRGRHRAKKLAAIAIAENHTNPSLSHSAATTSITNTNSSVANRPKTIAPLNYPSKNYSIQNSFTSSGLSSNGFEMGLIQAISRDCQNTSRGYGFLNGKETQIGLKQEPIQKFIDDWPRNNNEDSRSLISNCWASTGVSEQDNTLNMGSQRSTRPRYSSPSNATQLSISIPALALSDMGTPTISPRREKLTSLSPLKLSMGGEDPIQMGLGVGLGIDAMHNSSSASSSGRSGMTIVDDHSQLPPSPGGRSKFWIPIEWDSRSVVAGGPLAEVLQQSTTPRPSKSSFDLMSGGSESNSTADNPALQSTDQLD